MVGSSMGWSPVSNGKLSRQDLERRVAELEAEVSALRARTAPHLEHFRAIIESSQLGVVVYRDGPPLYANDAFLEMVGIARDELLATPKALDWVHEKDRALSSDYLRQVVAGERQTVTGPFRLLSHDDAIVWVEGHTTRVIWDGEPALATAMINISGRRAAERQERTARKLFQAIFNATPDVVTVADVATGQFVDVNDAFLMHSSHRREDVVGASPDDVGIYGDRAFRAELVRRVAEEGAIRDIETTARTRLGNRVFTVSAQLLSVDRRQLLLAVGRMTPRNGWPISAPPISMSPPPPSARTRSRSPTKARKAIPKTPG